ncbi:MAG: hypothetical protein JXA21_28680 [Anaerolineae bacterium]|nr:hypothetical protein [Anaerolineae bacterium]
MRRELRDLRQKDGVRLEGDVAGMWLEATLTALPRDVVESALVCAIPAWFDLRLLVLLTGKPDEEADDILSQWAAAGLIAPAVGGGYSFRPGIRKRLLRVWQSPSRQYGFTRLARILAEHYLAFASDQISRLSGPDFDDALRMLDVFYPNLEAAWEAALAMGDCDLVYRLVAAVDPYHSHRHLWMAKVEWLESGVLACECLHNNARRAEMLNSQGVAYMHLAAQGRAGAVEKAIDCYEAALAHYTPKDTPNDFVMVQNNLGNAYMQAQGNLAANLSNAIHCYDAALRVCQLKESPLFYAVLHSNRGFAYLALPADDLLVERHANLQRALESFQAALKVYSPKTAPFIYAKLQVGMGSVYAYLLTDETGTISKKQPSYLHNLHAMIACYREALRFYTYEIAPVECAEIYMDLGGAYTLLAREGDVDSAQQALSAYKSALHFYTLESAPERYAEIQMSLGLLYNQLSDGCVAGRSSRYLRRAIACYDEALLIYTLDHTPLLYAQLQVYLGIAYARLSVEERSRDSQQAFVYYQEALKEFSENESASAYADFNAYLGTLYTRLATMDVTDSLRHAIACYEASLVVYTLENAPQAHASIQDKLSTLYAELHSQVLESISCAAVQA